MLRICLIPIIAILLGNDESPHILGKALTSGQWAALLIVLAGITDGLDGYIARMWKIESLLGKFLDPLADKLLLLVGLVMLMQLRRVEYWLVILLLSRELMITGLRAVAIGESIVISAGQSGKWKHTLQMVGLGFLTWHGNFLGIPASTVGTVILYVSLVISLLSGYCYLRDFFTALIAKKRLGG